MKEKNSKVILIANEKGGTGKTTTCVNTAVALANMGAKVLVIDADFQGHTSMFFGLDKREQKQNLATLLFNHVNGIEPDFKNSILKTEENVDVILSNKMLSGVQLMLINAEQKEYQVKKLIEPLKSKYDYILFDSHPTLDLMATNLLTAADSVIIPVEAQYLPAEGMVELVGTIGQIKQSSNPNLKIDGVLIVRADYRTNLTKSVVKTLREDYGSQLKIFKTVIPTSTKIAESPSQGKSIFAHDKNDNGAKAYQDFAKEVLEIGRAKVKSSPTQSR